MTLKNIFLAAMKLINDPLPRSGNAANTNQQKEKHKMNNSKIAAGFNLLAQAFTSFSEAFADKSVELTPQPTPETKPAPRADREARSQGR